MATRSQSSPRSRNGQARHPRHAAVRVPAPSRQSGACEPAQARGRRFQAARSGVAESARPAEVVRGHRSRRTSSRSRRHSAVAASGRSQAAIPGGNVWGPGPTIVARHGAYSLGPVPAPVPSPLLHGTRETQRRTTTAAPLFAAAGAVALAGAAVRVRDLAVDPVGAVSHAVERARSFTPSLVVPDIRSRVTPGISTSYSCENRMLGLAPKKNEPPTSAKCRTGSLTG